MPKHHHESLSLISFDGANISSNGHKHNKEALAKRFPKRSGANPLKKAKIVQNSLLVRNFNLDY